MAAKKAAESIGNTRPTKKVKSKAPSSTEQQRPRFAPASVNMTPTSAQQPPVDLGISTITSSKVNSNDSVKAPVAIPNSVPKPQAQPSDSVQEEDAPPVLPPHLTHLTQKYSFATMSVNTGSKIEQKVRVLISRLSRFNFLDREIKPGVVALRARANVASKLITVVEIAKREIEYKERSGKWYQYSQVSAELREIPRNKAKKGPRGQQGDADGAKQAGKSLKEWELSKKQDTVEAASDGNPTIDLSGGDNEEEAAFEIMADARPGRGAEDTKLRNIPLLTIYMSRVPVPELKVEFRHV